MKSRFLFLLSLALLCSCAKVVSPTGGDKDITPPEVVNVYPANKTTNFQGKEILIEFDEYFKLDQPNQNILISPIPASEPEYKITKKSLNISFTSDLEENTTYTIFFGESIKDINEGNTLSNFRYVFSTGDALDSLSFKGNAKDAFTNLPVESVKILAYPLNDTIADSCAFLHKPSYIAITNKDGSFAFENLPNKLFKLFACEDINKNYIIDPLTERFDFLLNEVTPFAQGDSISPTIDFKIFKEKQELKRSKYKLYQNKWLQLWFNNPVNEQELNFNIGKKSLEKITFSENNSDSLILALDSNLWNNSDSLLIISSGLLNDTLNLKPTQSNRELKNNFSISVKAENLNSKIYITNSLPFTITDSAKSYFMVDSTIIPILIKANDIDTAPYEFTVPVNLADSILKAEFILEDSSIYSSLNNAFNDSISFSYSKIDSSDIGSFSLQISNPDNKSGFLELRKDETVVIKNIPLTNFNSPLLEPGNYSMKFYEDLNNNGKWDSGNFGKREKPEPVQIFPKAIVIKANWILEYNWEI